MDSFIDLNTKNCSELSAPSIPIHSATSELSDANRLAEIAKILERPDTSEEDISQCAPPWIEEDIIFDFSEEETCKDENNETEEFKFKLNNQSIDEKQDYDLPCMNSEHLEENAVALKNEKQISNTESVNNISCIKIKPIENDKENIKEITRTEVNNEENNSTMEDDETQVAKELLHNLQAILKNSGTITDKKKLGVTLLNSLALALNIKPDSKSPTETQALKPLQRSKSDSRVNLKKKTTYKDENKLTIPKITSRTAAPIKFDKNLKVKSDREKNASKGPLKALVPLTCMAKNKESMSPKNNIQSNTPPKQTHFKIKTQTTPNESKCTPPMAHSTPEILKETETGTKKKTPIMKRQIGFSISPLGRPLNASDVSNISLNKSLSPRNGSDSELNLNKSGSNLTKHPSTSLIPTFQSMTRRNSVSDMSTSSCSQQRSYENDKPTRPVPLKRSSSFQSKTTTASVKKENSSQSNTSKKYALPEKLKSLKWVPKGKKT